MTFVRRLLLGLMVLTANIFAFADSPVTLKNATIGFYSSNTLGMSGQLLKQADESTVSAFFSSTSAQKSLRTLASPDAQGDILAKALVKSFVGKVDGRWVLLSLNATENGATKRWNRLLDYEKNEGSLLIQTLNPAGAVSIEEMYRTGLLRRRSEFNADGNPSDEYYYINADAPKTETTDDKAPARATTTTVTGAAKSAAAPLSVPATTTKAAPAASTPAPPTPAAATPVPRVVLDEHRKYTYDNGRPAKLEATGADGKPIYSVTFFYTLDGSIRQTEKKLADGSSERFLYRYGPIGLSENWQDDPLDGNRWQYDAQGRVIQSEEWKNGALLSSVTTTWAAPQGNLIASRDTKYYKTSVTLEEVYDTAGRLVQSDENHAGELYRRISQVWDADGKLTLRSMLTQGREESWAWEYAKGVLTTQRYSKDGVPVTVITYQDKDRVEELYLDGKPILRVYYHDTVRYKEEELRDGNVTRTRTVK